MDYQDIDTYIISEEANWKTVRVPLTDSKDWNMYEHIQRCKNVANAWFHSGQNDGLRPYDDLVTPIINVAFRTEGFDVKDIVPFVNDAVEYHKSFLVKKYHPKWARKHEIDTLIDKAVESSIIYDLVIFKNTSGVPEVQPLETISFCDQTDVLAGPLCFKHQYSISELLDFKGKWNDERIDSTIVMAKNSKAVSLANGKEAKTPGKYIEVYELLGNLPESWLKDDGDPNKYVPQLQIITFYVSDIDSKKHSITLFKGKSKPLTEIFDALKIDQVRSYGRACGRSIVESLFEPQVWNNYSAIKIKEKLDAAMDVFVSDSDEIGNQKLSDLPKNTILKQEKGATTSRLNGSIVDMDKYMAHKQDMKESARVIGSASEGALGVNPSSGTPMGLEQLVVQQGQGIHEYRQGKIATFFSDRLYKNWILKGLVDDINKGNQWLEELTLEELQWVADIVSTKQANKQAVKLVINKQPKDEITNEQLIAYRDMVKEQWMKGGNKRFLETMKDELKDIPVDVFVNIAGKQAYLSKDADKITNLIREAIRSPQGFQPFKNTLNELLEKSGLSPIKFTELSGQQLPQQQPAMAQ